MDNYRTLIDGSLINTSAGKLDQLVGKIFDVTFDSDFIGSKTLSKHWDFGSFGSGCENFRAVLSIIPVIPKFTPSQYITGQVIIDLG